MSIEPVTGTHQEGGSTNVPPSVNAAEPVPTQPRSSWRLLKVLVALVILSPLAIGTYVLWPSGDALEEAIRKLGYHPIRVPSNLYTPGSLFRVSTDGIVQDEVCKAGDDVILGIVQKSAVPNWDNFGHTSSKFAFKSKIIQRINATLNGNYVKAVNLESVSKVMRLGRGDERAA